MINDKIRKHVPSVVSQFKPPMNIFLLMNMMSAVPRLGGFRKHCTDGRRAMQEKEKGKSEKADNR
jgi:hypothetical protein